MIRKFARLRWIACFLSEYEWFRKIHGGKWMRTHVDYPVCSCLWLPVSDDATPEYREPLWRGTPEFVDYDKKRGEKS